MLSLSILLPVLHTHAAQPSHCRLADRQNSEGQQVNNETLVRKKAGLGPSVMLSSTRCSVRCLFIVVLVGLLRLFCQIAYDGSSPVCTAPLHLATADQTLLNTLWQISILLTMTLKHSPVTFLISFQSQALNEIWPFFATFCDTTTKFWHFSARVFNHF